MKGQLVLKEQEVEGELLYSGFPIFIGRMFKDSFLMGCNDSITEVITTSIEMIDKRYGGQSDWLQIFIYTNKFGDRIKYYVIHDYTHITFVLPEER